MSRYEERLAADKASIRERVSSIGGQVERAVAAAVETLLVRDRDAAYRIVLGDLPINREIRAIDASCHSFVARHLPSAGHLRFVSSVLQMNVALERIGDYAVTIAREAVQLAEDPPEPIAAEMRALSDQVCGILRETMKAFSSEDVELARAARPQARRVERKYGQTLRDLITKGMGRPLPDTFALLTVFSKLERVSDQAKNIAEETLFELVGETKPPKRYKILFVDTRSTLLAPLAEVLARKAFPKSGHFDSAGIDVGNTLAPELGDLADKLGLDFSGVRPAPLNTTRAALEEYHVVVCLGAEVAAHIRAVPYATVMLTWELSPLADPAGEEDITTRLDRIAKELAGEIRDLMFIMRGPEAD